LPLSWEKAVRRSRRRTGISTSFDVHNPNHDCSGQVRENAYKSETEHSIGPKHKHPRNVPEI